MMKTDSKSQNISSGGNMKLVFGECFMYSTLFMAHKLSRVWSLKVKVYFGKGIRVITLMYNFILMPDLQMTN